MSSPSPEESGDTSAPHSDDRQRNREKELQQICEALRGLRFGAVNVIVQDGVVVQIDRTEKRRLRRPEA